MRGFTLVEALLALLLLLLLSALGLPRVVGLRDRLLVEAAAARLLEGYERARVAALRSGGSAVLEVTSDQFTVSCPLGGDTLPVWNAPGPGRDGVALVASLGRVAFGPNGLSYGFANGRFEFRRGMVTRALIASRPGRLRVERLPRRRGRTPGRYGP